MGPAGKSGAAGSNAAANASAATKQLEKLSNGDGTNQQPKTDSQPAKPGEPNWKLATGAQKRPAIDAAQMQIGKNDAKRIENETEVATWTGDWRKTLKQNTPERTAQLQKWAVDATVHAQEKFTKQNAKLPGDDGHTKRAQHARAVYATTAGSFKVSENIPKDIQFGPFKKEEGAPPLRALVRISNVSGTVQKDGEPDLRGFALRLTDDKGKVQDIMMNTSEMFMTKNAEGAIVGIQARADGLMGLVKGVIGQGYIGPDMSIKEAKAMKNASDNVKTSDRSVAEHTYWSRTPFQLGDKAVKFRLRPVPEDQHSEQPLTHGTKELQDDMRMRLQDKPVRYYLEVQGYVDETKTPMNDATKTWDSEFVTVGVLELPKLPEDKAQAETRMATAEGEIDKIAYSISNRWTNDDSSLKGLGDINSIREKAYTASAEGRGVEGAQGLRCPMGYG